MSEVTKNTKQRGGESGNVLFLILIAVALFAALSYAVTQSTRSGSGDASGETNLIGSAQVSQYPAGVRTSLVRMIISGTSTEQLEFNQPSEFGSLTNNNFGVFHPTGGGAVFARGPSEVMASGNQTDWIFSSDYEILEIGLSDHGSGDTSLGNDIIAFLPDVSANVCRKLNEELGISTSGAGTDTIPGGGISTANLPADANTMDSGNTGIGADIDQIDGNFAGQPFGCLDVNDDDSAPYLYYHVLIER